MSGSKPTVRVPAGSSPIDGTKEDKSFLTRDSFQNLRAGLGYGANNLASGADYAYNPVSRNRFKLEMMYRSSWIVRQVIDAVADDMTRAGIAIDSDMKPDQIDLIFEELREKQVWNCINSTIKWARLYGGCLAMINIEGQRPDTPLRVNTVGIGQFLGMTVMDRWMVWASTDDIITDPGLHQGKPRYYTIVADARGMTSMKIHHTRVIRLDGVELPYFQAMSENSWGISVIEPLYDRLIAFDSVSMGAAQLAYKAHLRVIKVEKLREIIAAGGMVYQAFLQQMQMIRMMQTNEGMTILDASDSYEANAYAFGGLSDLINQFGQQLSGASQIPLTRLFGQSPNGMSATGESDLRTYYDGLNAQQEARLRLPLTTLLEIVHRSKFGRGLPDGFGFSFRPLWLLTETDRATISSTITQTVDNAVAGGLINRVTALKELRQQSRLTGVWTNITDEDIKKAEAEDAMPPPPMPGIASDPQAAKPPETDDSEPLNGSKRHPKAKQILSVLYPNTRNLTRNDIKVHGPIASPHLTHDQGELPMRDFHGLRLVIETEKGARRVGHGWSTILPAAYGYISGTGSMEGSTEQFDCFLGPDLDSRRVWVIEQNDLSGAMDEHKAMLGFSSRKDAVDAYINAFSDGKGEQRIGRVLAMDIDGLKSLLKKWPYHTTHGLNGSDRL